MAAKKQNVPFYPERLLGRPRRLDGRGRSIGCVDPGALILARAGLLPRGDLRVHHAELSGAREDHRADSSTDRLYAFHERRFSSAGVPAWTMRHLFRRHLATTPAAYYRRLRLQCGRELLAYSYLSVAEIATACSSAEVASLSHAFARLFGVPPSRARRDETGLPA